MDPVFQRGCSKEANACTNGYVVSLDIMAQLLEKTSISSGWGEGGGVSALTHMNLLNGSKELSLGPSVRHFRQLYRCVVHFRDAKNRNEQNMIVRLFTCTIQPGDKHDLSPAGTNPVPQFVIIFNFINVFIAWVQYSLREIQDHSFFNSVFNHSF